jgi:hypothetical protein
MEIDYIKEIQDLNSEIIKDIVPLNTPLIKQTFLVWYALVDGHIEIPEDYLQEVLDRNILLIKKYYPKDPELLFLQGWMIAISPWYVNSNNDDNSDKYFGLAYKYRSDNLLFKWTLIDDAQETKISMKRLESSILENLHSYLINYKPIQEYFRRIIGKIV